MSLNGKTVLVTGSSRGIGKAIALAFAKEGCNIILNASQSSDELLKTQDEFKALGYYSYSYLADVSNYSQCKQMFKEIYSLYGKIDILINNAGISLYGLFSDTSPSDWGKIMKINTGSVLNCCHLAIDKMVHDKAGVIINISSIWGEKGASCETVYCASKGAVNSFTKALAKELGPSNIRVNAIACGVIDTKMNAWLSPEEKSALKDEISLMRFGKAEEVANLCLYLAKDESSFLTGQIITLDGGMI